MENIIFIIICFGCAALFFTFGIYALKKKTPIHFWSGTTVKSEEVTNVIGYNKEICIMWILYSGFYLTAGLMGLFSISYIPVIILLLSIFPGIMILILNYKRIEKKYFIK